MVKSTGSSCRGARFGSQHPRRCQLPSVTLVPGDSKPTSGFLGHCTHVAHLHICRQNVHTHKVKEMNERKCLIRFHFLKMNQFHIIKRYFFYTSFEKCFFKKKKAQTFISLVLVSQHSMNLTWERLSAGLGIICVPSSFAFLQSKGYTKTRIFIKIYIYPYVFTFMHTLLSSHSQVLYCTFCMPTELFS